MKPFAIFSAQAYLSSVGEAVAGLLKPLGIDVDVDVEHHGKRSKCAESEIKRKQREEAEKEKAASSSETPPESTEGNWLLRHFLRLVKSEAVGRVVLKELFSHISAAI